MNSVQVVRRGQEGKPNFKDDAHPDRPLTAVTEENVDTVERLIDWDHGITCQSI